jgi:hypothetical protein
MNFEDVNIKSITFSELETYRRHSFSKAKYGMNGKHVQFLTPILEGISKITYHPTGQEYIDCQISDDDDAFYNFLVKMDEMCINGIVKNSKRWFGKDQTIKRSKVEKAYRSIFVDYDPNVIRLWFPSKRHVPIYTRDRHKIKTIYPKSKLRFLLSLRGIWINDRYVGSLWEIDAAFVVEDPRYTVHIRKTSRKVWYDESSSDQEEEEEETGIRLEIEQSTVASEEEELYSSEEYEEEPSELPEEEPQVGSPETQEESFEEENIEHNLQENIESEEENIVSEEPQEEENTESEEEEENIVSEEPQEEENIESEEENIVSEEPQENTESEEEEEENIVSEEPQENTESEEHLETEEKIVNLSESVNPESVNSESVNLSESVNSEKSHIDTIPEEEKKSE